MLHLEGKHRYHRLGRGYLRVLSLSKHPSDVLNKPTVDVRNAWAAIDFCYSCGFQIQSASLQSMNLINVPSRLSCEHVKITSDIAVSDLSDLPYYDNLP